MTSSSSSPTKKVKQIMKKFLEEKKEDEEQQEEDKDVDQLVAQITELFITPETNENGGIYFVTITSTPLSDMTFKQIGVRLNPYVMIKFGKTDDFKRRMSAFGFNSETIFKFSCDHNTESDIKKALPNNFSKCFFQPKTKADTIKKYFGCQTGSPGPTEWRVVTKNAIKKLQSIVALKKVDRKNVISILNQVFNHKIEIDTRQLSIAAEGNIIFNLEPTIVYEHVEVKEEKKTKKNS